jgi:hypothetical protein
MRAGRPCCPVSGLGMDAPERLDQIRHQQGKAGVERLAPRDQNIVEVASCMIAHNVTDGSLEPPLDTIALHRNADLLADREAEPGPTD